MFIPSNLLPLRPVTTTAASPTTHAVALAPMTRRESLYLDLVRALAAFLVVLDHAQDVFDLRYLPRFGHQAVVVFFVLSGYVISFVADTREQGAREFLIARFARLWSVLIPAIALTIACDFAGQYFGVTPEVYKSSLANWPIIRVAAAIGFVSESWVSIQLFSNGVVWSLCLEFWYYMLFAAWAFAPKGKARWALIVLTAVCAGHKGLLLAPVWLCGVALYRMRILRRLSPAACSLLCFGGLIAIVGVLGGRAYDAAWTPMARAVGPWMFNELAQARLFWMDWILGIAVAAHFAGARYFVTRIPMERIGMVARWGAGISFATYLFHEPLLNLCAAYLPRSYGALALVITLATIAVIGRPIEKSKRWWTARLETAWSTLSRYQAWLVRKIPPADTTPAVASTVAPA